MNTWKKYFILLHIIAGSILIFEYITSPPKLEEPAIFDFPSDQELFLGTILLPSLIIIICGWLIYLKKVFTNLWILRSNKVED